VEDFKKRRNGCETLLRKSKTDQMYVERADHFQDTVVYTELAYKAHRGYTFHVLNVYVPTK
jgi:hypothetical protein